jgi:hypothetical protein
VGRVAMRGPAKAVMVFLLFFGAASLISSTAILIRSALPQPVIAM